MSRFVALCLVVFLALSPLSLSAQEEGTYPLESSVMAGPGLEGLEITGTPDEHGLIWHIQEPRRSGEAWVVVAYNAGNAPVSNVTATLEYLVDGSWYLTNLQGHEKVIYPGTIQPGEFGFQKMGAIGGRATKWDESRIVVDSVTPGASDTLMSLGIKGGSVSTQGYTGTFENKTGHTVERITLIVGCAVDGEIVDVGFHVSDLHWLDPGESEPFSFRTTVCDHPDQTILTAGAAAL